MAAVAAALPLCAAAAEHAFSVEVPGAAKRDGPVWRVGRDDTVSITVTSGTAGEVHVHGYRLSAAAKAQAPARLRFKAHATGRYRLEWHPAGDAASHHHGPALATLEVMPR